MPTTFSSVQLIVSQAAVLSEVFYFLLFSPSEGFSESGLIENLCVLQMSQRLAMPGGRRSDRRSNLTPKLLVATRLWDTARALASGM